MAKSGPPPGDRDKKIADANWLMGDTSKSSPKPKPKPGTPPPSAQGGSGDEDHSYDLAGQDDLFTVDEPEPVPVPIPAAPEPKRKARPKLESEWDVTDEGAPEHDEEAEASAVDQVWSRGGEWGMHLFWVGLVAGAIAFCFYKAIVAVQFLLALVILAIGAVVLLALCYPIFITLERPVRITPEQAAKDYYAMLSYPWPFYPRMWLLLSTAGRHAPEFSSYGQFKSYWKRKLASIQRGRAPLLNPLRFQVENFTAGKSAGQTAVSAKYTLKIFKGEPAPGNRELASYVVSTGLVKGPDRMWYLNSGTLPNERR
jgi:hypothetical protein